MKLRTANPLAGYGLAILFLAIAFGGRWALTPIIGESAPFMFFILAAVLSAVFGGIGPGLLAMIGGQFLGHYFFTKPLHTYLPADMHMWVYWSLYDTVTLICLALVEALHRVSAKAEDNMSRAKRHEEQLRTIIREMTAAQERVRELASVVESAEDAIISMTLDGQIKSWNAGAERMFGFGTQEMHGRSIDAIVPEDKREEHRKLLGCVASGENTPPIETLRIGKNGLSIEVSIRCSPLRNNSGKVTGVSAIARDISRAKRAEAEITRLNRDLNHHLTETKEVMRMLPVGLAISATPDCRILEINPAFAQMLGVQDSELRLDSLPLPFCVMHNGSEVLPSNLPMRLAAAENREIRDWEARIVRADGSTVDVLSQAVPLHDEEGRIRGVLGAVVDISDLKRAHAALQETEQRFRAMADNAPLMIWMTDAAQRSTWVNKTWRDFTGRSNDSESPEGWAEPVHPEDKPAWAAALKTAEQRKESFEIEYRLRKADGEWRWVLDRGVPRFGHGGQFLGFIGSCMDVTEWKQAEEALENKFDELRQAQLALRAQNEELARSRRAVEIERARYHELFDSAPVGYLITSRQGVIQQANRAAAEMLEESPKFLEGFPFARLLAKQDRASFFANIGKLTRRETNCIQGWEANIISQTRPAFPCSIGVNLIEDDEHRITGLRWILRDITDRKETEQRIMRLNAELEERVRQRTAALEAANRELEAFSYSVSHDLRAPLRSVEGFSKAVLEDYRDKLDEQGVKYLRYAREAAVRMSHLIEDLLELSRASRGEIQWQRVDLTELALSVAADLRQTTQREVSVSVRSRLWAMADGGLLRIALENLLSNAWKFTSEREHPSIEVGFAPYQDRPCVFIRDNGAGFSMSGAGRLFGAFQRLHSQNEFPGTGIGLATVKRILVRHCGDIWGEGTVNEGATFYFTLPEIGCDSPPGAIEYLGAAPQSAPQETGQAEPRSKRLRSARVEGEQKFPA